MHKKILLLISCFCINHSFIEAQNLQWAKTAGSASADIGLSIAVDQSGNVYTTGYFEGTVDFDNGVNVYNLTSNGDKDVFVTKMDATGNLMWAKNVGGLQDEEGHGIAVDNSGNVYVTGRYNGTADFDPNAGLANLSVVGPTEDIFVLKLDQVGDYAWAKGFGNYGSDVGASIAVDANNNVCFTGYFNWVVDFNPNTGIDNLTAIGGRDIFICKLDQNANFIWAKSMGSNSGEEGLSIAIDNIGSVYTTGFIADTTDFDPGANVFNLYATGMDNVFISKLDANGNFVWAKSIGSTEPCHGNDIAVDGLGKTYVTGYFQGTVDFDPGAGNLNLNANGVDIFIVKLDTIGDFIWAKSMGGGNADKASGIAADALGNVYTTGVFEGTADFDPNGGTFNLTAQFVRDMFICKLDDAGNLTWAKNITGAAGLSEGNDIAVDVAQNIYTIGYYYGTVDFDFNTAVDDHLSNGAQDIFVMKVDQLPTKLQSISKNNTFNVYPNPSNGLFYLQYNAESNFEKGQLTVSDINGNLLQSSHLFFNSKNVYELELNNLAKGVYFIQINFNNSIIHTKIAIN